MFVWKGILRMVESTAPNEKTWLLAIDTSTEQASLALFNGVNFAEMSWSAGRDQTVSVLSEFGNLARLAGCSIATQLGCVAIATGPGMFNGLRVGMSIAKGFALACDTAVIGVPTLEIAAHPFLGAVAAVASAGRARVLWQFFSDGKPAGIAVNGSFTEFVAELETRSGRVTVTGELNELQWEALAHMPAVFPAPAPTHMRRAGSLATIAWRRWQLGEIDDPETLHPTYLHANATDV